MQGTATQNLTASLEGYTNADDSQETRQVNAARQVPKRLSWSNRARQSSRREGYAGIYIDTKVGIEAMSEHSELEMNSWNFSGWRASDDHPTKIVSVY